jgi:hypothetical protein
MYYKKGDLNFILFIPYIFSLSYFNQLKHTYYSSLYNTIHHKTCPILMDLFCLFGIDKLYIIHTVYFLSI